MKFIVPTIAIFLSLSVALPSQAGDQKTEALKAGGAAAGGATMGGIAFASLGSGGLAIAGTAFTISAAPFVAAGAVVGLAGYGIYRVFSEPADSNPENFLPRAKIIQLPKR